MKTKRIWNEIKSVKAEDDNSVTIEGWANRAVVDDMGDMMKFDKVDMQRYEKNPILLYNHDRNLPVGRVVETKLSEQGLWVKGVISNSKDVVVSYVRDLVKEGILKTFSIGFEPRNEERKADHNEITEWRLNEISIVTLPANIEAEFTLAKALGDAKSLDEARSLVLKAIEGQKAEPAKEPEEPKEPKPQEGEEPKPQEDEAKNAFQQCVAEKVPQLVEEGRSQDEAVAIAMSMCREEGKCAIDVMSKEAFEAARSIAAAAAAKKKPEEGTKAAPGTESTPVPQPSDDPSNYGNPHLDLMKSQIALLGKISEQVGTMVQLLAKRGENAENEGVTPVEPDSPQGQAPAKGAGLDEEIEIMKQRINGIIKELAI